MKKLLLSLGACLAIASASFSQTTLFQDDFESGSSQWNLNTGTGANTWVVNNAYLGFAGLIPDTPNQPGAVTNSPQSTYMHITNTTVCAGLSVCNANFDTGSATDQNAEVATAIDASLYTNVTVSFWYLSAGSTGTSFGTMEYSLDGGSTWITTGTEYSGTPSWTQESVSLPAWDNASAFKIRFKWQNGGAGLDPAFSVDELLVVGTSAPVNTITTDTNLQPTSWCEGNVNTMQINFTSTGTFNAGNIYTAELSDAAGSFAAPLAIGTLASTANTGMIVAIVPGSVVAGTGYRIRVVSNDPVTIGTDNTTDLVIEAGPTMDAVGDQEVCNGEMTAAVVFTGPVGGTIFSWSNSDLSIGLASGGLSDIASFTGTNTGALAAVGTITVSPSANGCSGTPETFTITVNPSPAVSLSPIADVCNIDPFFSLTGGSPSGGTFSGPGVVGGIFDPATAGPGTHTISYMYTDSNTGCSGTAVETIFVDVCGAIGENEVINFIITPNPTDTEFEISTEAIIESVELRDLNGKLVKIFVTSTMYNVADVPTGMYIIVVTTETSVSQKRVVIK